MTIVARHGDVNEIVEIRGASGARVLVGPNTTMKFDVQRTGTFVRDQGAWLSRWCVERGITMLPQVTEVFSTGYTMETLRVPPLREIDVMNTCELIIDSLRTQLWKKIATEHRNADNFIGVHRPYVTQLIKDVEENRPRQRVLSVRLREFHDQIDWNNVDYALTHGDAIIDNVGFRRESNGEVVLFDPIPASDALPNWSCVDVGRVIQSMIGYEHVRYANRAPLTHGVDYDAAVATVLNWYMPKNFRVNEARACLYFAIIHMLRAIRTTTPGTASRLGVWFLVNKLIEVTRQWMR